MGVSTICVGLINDAWGQTFAGWHRRVYIGIGNTDSAGCGRQHCYQCRRGRTAHAFFAYFYIARANLFSLLFFTSSLFAILFGSICCIYSSARCFFSLHFRILNYVEIHVMRKIICNNDTRTLSTVRQNTRSWYTHLLFIFSLFRAHFLCNFFFFFFLLVFYSKTFIVPFAMHYDGWMVWRQNKINFSKRRCFLCERRTKKWRRKKRFVILQLMFVCVVPGLLILLSSTVYIEWPPFFVIRSSVQIFRLHFNNWNYDEHAEKMMWRKSVAVAFIYHLHDIYLISRGRKWIGLFHVQCVIESGESLTFSCLFKFRWLLEHDWMHEQFICDANQFCSIFI